jgi:hypothetical protein
MSYQDYIHDYFIDLMYESYIELYFHPRKPVKQTDAFEKEKKVYIRKTVESIGFDVYLKGRTDLKPKIRVRILEDLGI